jgi:hypothetical protein
MSQLQTNSIVPVGGIPAGASGGGIIQIVTGYNSGKQSTTSSSFVSLFTSPSITPRSSSNKILIHVSTMVFRDGANGNAYFAIYRNGSTSLLESGQAVHFSHWNDYSGYTQNNTSWKYIDSPATTSSINYQLMGRSDGGSNTAGVGGRGIDTSHNCGVLWTLMEVSG